MITNHRQDAAISQPKDPVEAVRRVNRRWIVHGGLRDSATAYLAELGEKDRERLRHSCGLAMDLVHTQAGQTDPKPWFYAGLFALAEPGEAERFLGAHPLTRLVWQTLNRTPGYEEAPESLRKLSCRIAGAIRQTMAASSR